jgi:hypothetical protein
MKVDKRPSYLKIIINIYQCKESGRVGGALKVMASQPSLSGLKIEPRSGRTVFFLSFEQRNM